MFQNQRNITKTRTPFCSYCHLLSANVKEILKKHSLWVQVLKKGEKQWLLGLLYHDGTCRIQKINFRSSLYLHKVYFSLFQPAKKLKRFHERFLRLLLKTDIKRLQKRLLQNSHENTCVGISLEKFHLTDHLQWLLLSLTRCET